MSWVEKELKRRSTSEARETASGASTQGESEPDSSPQTAASRIADLWARLEAGNQALPAALRLRRDVNKVGDFVGLTPMFPVALVANNGACLGFTEDGIRYLWPEKNARKSNNFWLRWKPEKGYVAHRRVAGSWIRPSMQEMKFSDKACEHMIKCLVTGLRIKPASLQPGRILFIWRRH
ncbi:MAG: hypothetical protein Q8M96_05995 [Rubrivivax sp.]|nr:hypothetical protein [Rubrivivax sp.]